jgi:hypothetical protein
MNTLLFNPSLFFSEKLKNEVNFKYPILIMLVYAIIGLCSSILVVNKIKESLPSDVSSFMLFATIGGAIGAIIGIFVYWIILTGIFYLISTAFHYEGSFKRTLEFVSYGFVPQIFSSIVGLLILYTLLPSINTSLQNPQLFAVSIENMFKSNPLFLASQIFGILCFLLSAYIWIFALLHARNMSIKNAIITVCVPVGLSLIYQLYLLMGRLT